jgi:hypothetical protein
LPVAVLVIAAAFLGGAVFVAAPERVAVVLVVPFFAGPTVLRVGLPVAFRVVLPDVVVAPVPGGFAVDFEAAFLATLFAATVEPFFAAGAALSDEALPVAFLPTEVLFVTVLLAAALVATLLVALLRVLVERPAGVAEAAAFLVARLVPGVLVLVRAAAFLADIVPSNDRRR